MIKIHATHILYKANQEKEFDPEKYPVEETPKDETCALCGVKIKRGVSTKRIYKTNFMDYHLFDPGSSHVCTACAFPFTEQTFRKTSFVATTDEFIPIKRPEIEHWLFNPPVEPFVFCITTSFKKHQIHKARASHSPDKFYVQFDDTGVMFDQKAMKPLFETMTEMYQIFSKTEILSGRYYQKRMKDYGLHKLIQAEKELKKHRGSIAFKLMVHALNKIEGEK